MFRLELMHEIFVAGATVFYFVCSVHSVLFNP